MQILPGHSAEKDDGSSPEVGESCDLAEQELSGPTSKRHELRVLAGNLARSNNDELKDELGELRAGLVASLSEEAIDLIEDYAFSLCSTKPGLAVEFAMLAVEAEPDNWARHYNLGDVLYSARRFNDAIQSFQRARHLDPLSSEVHTALASSLFKINNIEEACYHLYKSIELDLSQEDNEDREWVAEHLVSSEAANRMGDYADRFIDSKPKVARELLRLATLVSRKDPYLYNSLGVLQYQAGEIEQAIKSYNRAVKYAPHCPVMRYNIGKALAAAGREGKALYHLKNCLSLSKSDHSLASEKLKETRDLYMDLRARRLRGDSNRGSKVC